MSQHILEVLGSLHARLEKMERAAGLAGREITVATFEERLSWETLWHECMVWDREFEIRDIHDPNSMALLVDKGKRIARWILANRGNHPKTQMWAEREIGQEWRFFWEVDSVIGDLSQALREDGLSNGE